LASGERTTIKLAERGTEQWAVGARIPQTVRQRPPDRDPLYRLPQDARFGRLSTQSKHLIATIKMIAYRVEMTLPTVNDGFGPVSDRVW
jgi:hypothetical protein